MTLKYHAFAQHDYKPEYHRIKSSNNLKLVNRAAKAAMLKKHVTAVYVRDADGNVLGYGEKSDVQNDHHRR